MKYFRKAEWRTQVSWKGGRIEWKDYEEENWLRKLFYDKFVIDVELFMVQFSEALFSEDVELLIKFLWQYLKPEKGYRKFVESFWKLFIDQNFFELIVNVEFSTIPRPFALTESQSFELDSLFNKACRKVLESGGSNIYK